MCNLWYIHLCICSCTRVEKSSRVSACGIVVFMRWHLFKILPAGISCLFWKRRVSMILPQEVDRNAQLIATAAEEVKYVEEYVDDVEV